MVNTLFDSICEAPEHVEFTVKVSIAEIYLERIRDLLSPDKNNLKIRQDKQRGVYIEDVTESYVTEEKDIFDLMKLGNSNRAISATNMNEGSSRSHLIFMLSIHQNNTSEMSVIYISCLYWSSFFYFFVIAYSHNNLYIGQNRKVILGGSGRF